MPSKTRAASRPAMTRTPRRRSAASGALHTTPPDVRSAQHADAYLAARVIVEREGRDSLARFILHPQKDFHFAGGGVLAFRRFGRTAVVSGDPVAPPGGEAAVLTSFQRRAQREHLRVVVWGASTRHLDAYRSLGMRAVCAGEEAFVDPERFSLAGRRVRKLRQSVARIERRGWTLRADRGAALTPGLREEIEQVRRIWRAHQARLLGFAMSFGAFDGELLADDLYLTARAPSGELRAVIRFLAYAGGWSLDTMHRLAPGPNGLNEALICRALELARDTGVGEVSLNYAGLGHLVRSQPVDGWRGSLTGVALRPLAGRFQMQRLVLFNEKFLPEWRPRFLVYPARRSLPSAVMRVLQAEGHLGPAVRAAEQALPRVAAGHAGP